MHFWYKQADGVFTIHADVRDDHSDKTTGIRFQGDKTPLTLLERSVSFGVQVRDIDPDHFALAALLVFAPFVGSKVSFAVPVSEAITNFLASPGWNGFRSWPVEVVSKTVGRRVLSPTPVSPETAALALGGGFDAVSVKVLLPEVFSYHTVPAVIRNQVFYYPAYRFYAERHLAKLEGKPVCDAYIWSNLENIVEPRGVTTWPFFAIPALLLAKDRGLNCIMSGTVFEASFCQNGLRYTNYDEGLRNNFVYKVFDAIGFKLAPGATMLPEYLNMRTVIDGGLGDLVSFCIMGPVGGPCGKCLKCYRKKLLYEVLRQNGAAPVPQFASMTYAMFDNAYVRRLAGMRPIYMAASFKWVQSRAPPKWVLPSVREAMEALPDVRFGLDRFYTPGLALLPEPLASTMAERLAARHSAMREDEVAAVKDWDCTDPRAAKDFQVA